MQGLAAFGEDLAFTPREVEGLSARKAESVTICDSPPVPCRAPPKAPCVWRRLDAELSVLCLQGSNPSPSTYQLGTGLFNFSVPPSPHQKNGADLKISFRRQGFNKKQSINVNDYCSYLFLLFALNYVNPVPGGNNQSLRFPCISLLNSTKLSLGRDGTRGVCTRLNRWRK